MASLNDIANRALFKDQNIIISNKNYGIRCITGDGSDWFGIKGYGTTDNDSGMIIYTGDGMDEPIKCVQYYYEGNQSREITLMDKVGNQHFNSVHAVKVYNAVWNDYAEFYERGEHTEPGDIIGLNPNSDKEEYIKATNPSMCVGVHSDEYGHLIGGEQAPEGKDFVEYNMDKFIPVGLVGRVKTKIVGPISIGDKIVLSDIPGVGRKFIKGIDDSENIIGMAVENKNDESISRIRAHLRMGGGELNLSFIGSNPHCEVIQ
ncbi:MAG: hypothetical protein ACLT40_07260 [Fusobacterium sp.]